MAKSNQERGWNVDVPFLWPIFLTTLIVALAIVLIWEIAGWLQGF